MHFARPQRGLEGFTLIEMLLTISLIALFSSIFVLNIQSLLRSNDLDALENAFWDAVQEAKTQAVFDQRPRYLRFDEESRSFVVYASGSERRFQVDLEKLGEVALEVSFEQITPDNSYVLIAGKVVERRETTTVGFFPDGTCTPFQARLKIDAYETAFQIDPWTGAQLVEAGDDEA